MPNRRKMRRLYGRFKANCFKPAGIPASDLEEVFIAAEECEALRLADIEHLYQDEAAKVMGVSRATYARMLDTARAKIAKALLTGMAIYISSSTMTQEEKKMKIAIASTGKTLNDPVDQIFARARFFLFVDSESGEVTVVENAHQMGRGMGIQVAEQMIDQGVQAVIAGNFGPRAVQMLQAAGIQMITVSGMTGQEVLRDYQEKQGG